MARSTSGAPPWWTVAITLAKLCGSTCSKVSPERTSSPPITIGSSMRSARISAILRRISSRSAEPGA